jgi:segregation and condensation protein B
MEGVSMMIQDQDEPVVSIESEEHVDPVALAGMEYQDVGSLLLEIPLVLDSDTFRVAQEDLHAVLEALLFASGEPIGIDRLVDATGIEKERLRKTLQEMEEKSASDPRRGLMVREADGAWFLTTKPTTIESLRRLYQPRSRPALTQAAYETLAIIAYNQPATRSQIESIRGVGSDSIVSRLIERGLVREAGTLDAPGRPTLFETTEDFLQEFGLRSVHDLPSMEMMMYGTLREIEIQLEEAAGNRKDNQITIDQIVIPSGIQEEVDEPLTPSDPKEILELSQAFFGSGKDEE